MHTYTHNNNTLLWFSHRNTVVYILPQEKWCEILYFLYSIFVIVVDAVAVLVVVVPVVLFVIQLFFARFPLFLAFAIHLFTVSAVCPLFVYVCWFFVVAHCLVYVFVFVFCFKNVKCAFCSHQVTFYSFF